MMVYSLRLRMVPLYGSKVDINNICTLYIKHKELILSNKVSFNNKKSKYPIVEAKSSLFLAST